jgi:muramoyltetrapeptide carboxypeptidase LdcA involved in peptidoglycan recycling
MYIRPPFLKENDKVAIVATAKNFDRKELSAAIEMLKGWGLKVIEGKNLYKQYHQFAGNDIQRTDDLQWALDDVSVKAVFCARGGYGTARIIDDISFKKIIKVPKWVIGFSDVTTLHAELQKNKIQSIHGVMPLLFGQKGYKRSVEELKNLLFGGEIEYGIPSNKLNREGVASGKLTGGNLSIICSLIGTSSEINTRKKILFIEEVGENLYRLDRMMVQLKRAGLLKSLSGLIAGHFTAMEDNKVKFGKTAYEIVAEAVEEYKYPVCYGFPAGHEADNLPVVLGADTTLQSSKPSVKGKLSKIIQLFLFCCILGFNVNAQQYKVPENLYGIKNPLKEYDKRCQKCRTILQTMPDDVKYGTFAQDGYIYFVITDPKWYDKFFEKSGDGIAIDIIDKNWYVCGKKNKLANSWAYHGYLMKPMYQKEMNANLFQLENGSLMVKYAPVPEGLNLDDLEYNLLILKDKYLCHYSNFYDLRGEKWKLLEMGLFMDTLTENNMRNKTSLLSKEWRFEIPFEKNKSEYAQADVKPIHDSLLHNDFYIKSISIKAYSSVEGSLDNNIKLQEKRAQSIVRALQSYQSDSISATINASENWVEFLEDISDSKYAYLKTLSKDEIKTKLENKQLSAELEPYLRKHRKAILHVVLEKNVKYMEEDTFKLHKIFDELVAKKNIKEAIEVQQVIFSKVKENRLPNSFIKNLEVPEKTDFGMLLNNTAVFNYRQADANLLSTMNQFNKLLDLMPDNKRIKYNLCVLRLQSWVAGDSTIDPVKLKVDIISLKKSTIDPLLILRMLINYHIILSEYQIRDRNYAEKDKTVKYIYDNYGQLNLNDKDALSLSQYFVAYHKYDWAEKLLLKYAIKIDVDEDLLFYYINLTIAQPKTTASKPYRAIMLNAINLNRERFCAIFKPFGKGGISFQLLDNEYLKKTYCENCK